MTYKKDFNAIILHLLRGLVKDALQFEEIVSGSAANLDHIDVKVEELQSKVFILEILFIYVITSQPLPNEHPILLNHCRHLIMA